jgi:hypothetical protein
MRPAPAAEQRHCFTVPAHAFPQKYERPRSIITPNEDSSGLRSGEAVAENCRELHCCHLVYSLTDKPSEESVAWYMRPAVLGAIVIAIVVALNVIFW